MTARSNIAHLLTSPANEDFLDGFQVLGRGMGRMIMDGQSCRDGIHDGSRLAACILTRRKKSCV